MMHISAKKDSGFEQLAVFLLSLFITLITYGSLINKELASDDHEVVLRVSKGVFFHLQSFFRPVSDITLFLCYKLSGNQGWSYVLFNILVHSLCGLMIYKTCLVLFSEKEKKNIIAYCATLLFILYPFHHESLLWAVGRGSSLATLFAVLAMYISLIKKPTIGWIVLVFLLFFLSLSTYENTILVPFIAASFFWTKHKNDKFWWRWPLIFQLTAVVSLLVRYFLVGVIVGDYGERIFDFSPEVLTLKIFKAFGRFVLPPVPSEKGMILLSLLAGILLSLISLRLIKRFESERSRFYAILAALGFSFLLPALFGVNTRTLEGDRLYYFPSFFFAIWLAYTLVQICTPGKLRWALSFIIVYFLFFLHNGNKIWKRADIITRVILDDIIAFRAQYDKIYIVNLPEEYYGAHIFRNGFAEALVLNGVDSVGVELLSLQGPSQRVSLNKLLKPVRDSSGNLCVGSNTIFMNRSTVRAFNREYNRFLDMKIDSTKPVLYWNNKRIERLVY